MFKKILVYSIFILGLSFNLTYAEVQEASYTVTLRDHMGKCITGTDVEVRPFYGMSPIYKTHSNENGEIKLPLINGSEWGVTGERLWIATCTVDGECESTFFRLDEVSKVPGFKQLSLTFDLESRYKAIEWCDQPSSPLWTNQKVQKVEDLWVDTFVVYTQNGVTIDASLQCPFQLNFSGGASLLRARLTLPEGERIIAAAPRADTPMKAIFQTRRDVTKITQEMLMVSGQKREILVLGSEIKEGRWRYEALPSLLSFSEAQLRKEQTTLDSEMIITEEKAYTVNEAFMGVHSGVSYRSKVEAKPSKGLVLQYTVDQSSGAKFTLYDAEHFIARQDK